MKLANWIIPALLLLFAVRPSALSETPTDLEAGWLSPPKDARLRAYWWWLNGNVTYDAITRDLEEMKTKGFGGALICDAGGAEQDGNDQVPHGPTFMTPAWRDLYRHALREADRLGLELSLNIMSGWNLGGPTVTADDAAKKLTWSEKEVLGPDRGHVQLPLPANRDNYYRDLFVVAYRLPRTFVTNQAVSITLGSSSAQALHPASAAADNDDATFWVSDSNQPGEGPSKTRPASLWVDLGRVVTVNRMQLCGRPGYGPKEGELQVSADGKEFKPVKAFSAPERGSLDLWFPTVAGRIFRVVLFGAHDPNSPEAPRNVQIAELRFTGPEGTWPCAGPLEKPLKNWEQKAMHRTLHFSAPDTAPLFEEEPTVAGEENTKSSEVIDLTSHMTRDGGLNWKVPEGNWRILRIGCTIGDHSRVSTASEGWSGYALDVLDAGAFTHYWDAIVEPLIADAGPLAGKTLKYLHTDSWEVEAVNWTPTLRQEFRKRRGYDLLPFVPVLSGRVVDSRRISNRFLHDFRKTLGDLAIDNHYRIFQERAHKHGLLIHPESGGPHAVPIDAQRCLGWNDAPMSEFWAWSWRHRVGDANRFFIKQPASAAHTYGRKLVLAEGFTTIGPHWQETIWDNLKPSFDKAICEGLNLLVWHAFVCSPREMGMPGQQYFAGTHFNPNSTWWSRSEAFLGYINRSQHVMQRGRPVMDVAYYYGDHVPNFAQLKQSDPARVLPGYDYDVITENAILTRLSVRDERFVLPDGMSYRVLTLPQRTILSLPVLKKLRELVLKGGTILGPKPEEPSSLEDYPRCDRQMRKLANQLWGEKPAPGPTIRSYGRGRVAWGMTSRELLASDAVRPDFSIPGEADEAIDYFHRRDMDTDIYFVANRSNCWKTIEARFRVEGKVPELWNPVNGERGFAANYRTEKGLTALPMQFPPCGSWVVVFRKPASQPPPNRQLENWREYEPLEVIRGAWQVTFDPQWGGPGTVDFSTLGNWTSHVEPGVKFYSGTAVYRKAFDLPVECEEGSRIWLDLGNLRELAEVRLNGKPLGILWSPPFRTEISSAVRKTGNQLEISVVNFWPNRIIGDAGQTPEKRFTRTNVRKLTSATPLMEAGLFGPVQLLKERQASR